MSSVQSPTRAPAGGWTTATGRVLGCRFQVDVQVDVQGDVQGDVPGERSLVDHALHRLRQLEATWSRLLPMSELNRLNARPGQPVPVSDDLERALREAIRLQRFTGGRYDPAILPSQNDLGLRLAGDGTALLDHGTRLDLSGIEAGLAADIVMDELTCAGATSARIRIGDVYRAAGSEGWTVPVMHPSTGELVARHTLHDGAMASAVSRAVGRGSHATILRSIDPGSVVRLAVVTRQHAAEAAALAEAAVAAGPTGAYGLLMSVDATAWLLTPLGVVSIG